MDLLLLVAILVIVCLYIPKISAMEKEISSLSKKMEGLRLYLYEIDPQFDDERASRAAFENREHNLAGYDDAKLREAKERAGKRTLDTPF